MNPHDHWNAIYRLKGERDVSWFEPVSAISLQMVEASGIVPETSVLDIGAGESRFVDGLLALGLTRIAVLDISVEALEKIRTRLGARGKTVTWIDANVAGEWTAEPVDIWHDRATFHFLTDAGDRARYIQHLTELVKPHGTVIIATFASDGPEMCSGLPVVRYSPEALGAELGSSFILVETRRHAHVTPRGTTQSFQYSRFRRVT
jgi:2-polyprenyl-3-methyl-5-hydroxy-6-metoxy-1,4-benzoquinol methylase